VHRRREIAERTGQCPVEVLVDLAAGRRAQKERDADIDRAGCERRDDRLDASIDDDAAIDEAGERADRDARGDAEQDSADAAREGAEAEMQTEISRCSGVPPAVPASR